MRSTLSLFALVWMIAAAPVTAALTEGRNVERSIAAFVDAVNAGRQKEALAHLTSDVSIVEDLAPYHWQGPRAGSDWLEGMFRNGQKMGMSDIHMQLGKPTRIEVTGDRAYEVIPGVVTLNGKGKSLHESGALTFALRRQGRAWKIAAFSWSGERARP